LKKIPIFAHPVQKCARDCCPSYGSNVLPNGYSMSVRIFVRQVAGSWNFVKNDYFSPITLEKSTAGRGVSECRFNFRGQFCDIKFFPLYGLRYGLRNFCGISVRKHYDNVCLNLNNSKIWRRIPNIFQKLYKAVLSIWSIQKMPKMLHQFLVGLTWKRDIQQKLQFSGLPTTNCVRGWCPRYGAFFRGFSVLPNRHTKIAIFA